MMMVLARPEAPGRACGTRTSVLCPRRILERRRAVAARSHEGKQHGDMVGRPASQRVRGSTAIVDAAGAVLSVRQRKEVLSIEQTKASLGVSGKPVAVRFEDSDDGTMLRVVGVDVHRSRDREARRRDPH